MIVQVHTNPGLLTTARRMAIASFPTIESHFRSERHIMNSTFPMVT